MELYDSVIRCNIEDLPDISFPFNERVGLEIIHEGVKYEFLLNLKENSDYLIFAGSGVRTEKQRKDMYTEPWFHRWSWNFKQSIVYYNDPTSYIHGDLLGAWGAGTPDYWPIEIISIVCNKIGENLNFSKEDFVFYGSSMGGFFSILLATLNKDSYFVADIPQINFLKHGTRWPDTINKYCFPNLNKKELELEYGYRFNVFELMKRESYIPKGLLVLDLSFEWDVQHHYNYIFDEFSKLSFDNYHNEFYINVMGKNEGHYPYRDVQSLLDLVYVMRHSKKISKSLLLNNDDSKQDNDKIMKKLSKYNRGRIDIANRGNKGNGIQILKCSDDSASVKFPDWLKAESGSGCVIHSEKNFIDMEFICIGDGDVTIYLRGLNAHDSEGNRIPIFINYSNFILNDEVIFEEDKLVWHNKPFEKLIGVKHGDIIKMHVEWVPF